MTEIHSGILTSEAVGRGRLFRLGLAGLARKLYD